MNRGGKNTNRVSFQIIVEEQKAYIVFGSDFPHSPAKVILMKKNHFDENPKWDGIRERIYNGSGLSEYIRYKSI
jgi:hypothetical protein